MRIAVTYDNGEVFQHFGHTEEFKIYEVQDGKVLYSEVIDSMGQGHGALAGVLADNAVNVLICGGMGGGAQAALAEAGIETVTGVSGDADQAVEAYLKGDLETAGVNCDHHEEGHSCGDHGSEEGGCSCGGGCGGGCGQPQLLYEGQNAGKTVRVHYRGTFNDGEQFDSSYDRGQPLEFVCAIGMMIPGFDKAVVDMEIGEKRTIHLMPEEAYGPKDPGAIITVAIAECGGAEDLHEGEKVYLQNAYGQPVPVTVVAKDDINITFDANHEMAGKELNFDIELLEIL